MYKAVFFTEEEIVVGNGFSTKLTKREVNTGKSTIGEAFEVAVANGAGPFCYIEYVWVEE